MQGLTTCIETGAKYAAFHEHPLAIPSIPNQNQMARIQCNGANATRVLVAFQLDKGFAYGDVDCVLPEVIEQLDALNAGFANNTPQQAICLQAYLDEKDNAAASTSTCIKFYMPMPAATGLENTN